MSIFKLKRRLDLTLFAGLSLTDSSTDAALDGDSESSSVPLLLSPDQLQSELAGLTERRLSALQVSFLLSAFGIDLFSGTTRNASFWTFVGNLILLVNFLRV